MATLNKAKVYICNFSLILIISPELPIIPSVITTTLFQGLYI
jgi:hypothetical protein